MVQGSKKTNDPETKMAVDGRKLRDTLRHGSDDWIDFPCSPCAKEGKNVAAVKYCVECDENLCSACLTHHNKFAIMRGHQITDKLSSQTGQKRPDLPSQRCDKHGGKLVDLYCSRHDSVGCSACIAVDHRKCKEVKYIPDLTKGTRSGKGLSELETKLKLLSTQLEQLKQEKQDHLKHLQQEKERLLKEIRVIRKQINDKLNKMEKALVDDLNSKFDGYIQSTNKSVDTIVNMQASVETSRKNIQEAKQSNEAELFVQLKRGNTSLQIQENTFNRLRTDKGVRSMKLIPCNDIKKLLTQDKISLGRISEILVPKSTSHHGDFSVRMQSDTSTCLISGICLTTRGNVVISDCYNKSIKKLDESYAVVERLDLPEKPAGLCEVDSTDLAVTLYYYKIIQFVSQQPLRLGASFPVGDCCDEIACVHGYLYVCCGGKQEQGQGPGHIEVYDTTGVLLRSLYKGLSCPLSISATGDALFITESGKNNLIRVSLSGYNVSEMQIQKISGPVGSCRIGDCQLCITGRESNNIVLISEDGKEYLELLTKKDGIKEKPWAVCFDVKRSRLIVSFYRSDVIKVFNVIQ